MTTLNVDMNYPGYTPDNTHSYDCTEVDKINITYDSGIDENFTAIEYSKETLTITVCGFVKHIFTNIDNPENVDLLIVRSPEAVIPSEEQFNGKLNEFLDDSIDAGDYDQSEVLNIDMNYGMTANVMNYNCKGIKLINVTFDSEIQDMYKVHVSGSTVTIDNTDAYHYNFKNISRLEDVNFKVTRSEGALHPGEVQFEGTLKTLCDDFIVWTPTKGNKVDGSIFDDNIIIGEYDNALAINAGKGDDIIDGTQYNDTLTGGEGINVINLYTTKEFGDDVVVLTKGEQLTLKVVDQDAEDAHWNYTYSHIVGNDLVVDVYDDEIEWAQDEYGNNYPNNLDQINKTGSVTIKNYTKKDVMTNDGALLITDNNVNSTPENLRTGIYNVVVMDKDHFNKASYTGTWMNDEVHADKFKVYKKGVEVTTETEGFEKVKGATINLADAPFGGMNYAEGSIYADTLKGGNGSDMFEGGKGNDVMTGGKGSNSVIHNYEDGADTYNMTKDETLGIRFNGVSESEIQFEYANNNKDLKVFYEDDGGNEAGSVTIKNFASKNITNGAVVYGDELNGIDLTTDDVAITTIVDPDWKGNTVKGTWMNDMIDASGYTNAKGKGLTLNGGDGDNYVIGSNYGDTLTGGVGSDWLQGGQGNDKLTGGAESDVFIFDPQVNNGVDTITDATADDVISIANTLVPFSEDQLRYLKNGNNLEIYYDNTYNQENKIIVQKHFNKDGTRVATSLMTNDPELTNLSDVYYGITGSGKINGTEDDDIIIGSVKADTIKALGGNDEIKAGDGNDNVYGGKGDDIINAGAGKNNIYYSLDDGDDTIFAGGGIDTLVFDKGIAVTAEESGADVILTYSGTKKGVEYSNTITIDNYATTSVGYAKVNGKTVTIDQLLNGGGDSKIYHIKKTDEGKTFNLAKGNNTVIFDDAPILSNYNDSGCITLNSANKAGDGNTDTIDMSKKNQQDEGLSFVNNTVTVMDADGLGDRLWVDATVYYQCPGDGSFVYNDFYTDTAPNVVIKDMDRTYHATGYNTVQNLTLASDTKNRLVAIKAEEGTSSITSNGNYNAIYNVGDAKLNYTYGGGHDNVVSSGWNTDDTYNVALTANSSVNIIDWGGTDDTLTVTNTAVNKARVLFDVYKTTTYGIPQYEANTGHFVMTDVSNLSADVLATSTEMHPIQLTEGIHLNGGMDNITINGEAVDMDDWSTAIAADVGAWLSANNYNSVYDAFYGENPCTDQTQINALVQCYNVAYGS